jgi:hypothetical protein
VLLLGEIGVVDARQALVVPRSEDTAELPSGDVQAARHDQRGVPEVDEADLTAIIDSPAMAQLRWQARLTPM